MLSLRKRLERMAKQTGRRLDVLQQDYLLSWALAALFQHPVIKSSLVFKGGTALKKCYFGEYRFSEDLDFSATADLIESDTLFTVIKEAISEIEKQIREYAPLRLMVDLYKENKPHPQGQEAFQIRAQFPWQREPLTVIMIEISRDELLVLPPISRPLIHENGEQLKLKIEVYSLEEIILEKLRTILQHTKKLHERDWNRSRARDFYDLWSIFNHFHETLDLKSFYKYLKQKCEHRGVDFQDTSSFFNDKILTNVKRTWNQWLGPLVSHLPPYETVINELHPQIESLLNTN